MRRVITAAGFALIPAAVVVAFLVGCFALAAHETGSPFGVDWEFVTLAGLVTWALGLVALFD